MQQAGNLPSDVVLNQTLREKDPNHPLLANVKEQVSKKDRKKREREEREARSREWYYIYFIFVYSSLFLESHELYLQPRAAGH